MRERLKRWAREQLPALVVVWTIGVLVVGGLSALQACTDSPRDEAPASAVARPVVYLVHSNGCLIPETDPNPYLSSGGCLIFSHRGERGRFYCGTVWAEPVAPAEASTIPTRPRCMDEPDGWTGGDR